MTLTGLAQFDDNAGDLSDGAADASEPKVTVIMPVYNSERYVADAVGSVLAQDFDGFELLAVDDGSTDRSGEILDEMARGDGRLQVVHKGNGGMCTARNLGIERARGEYVMFCDNDDECLPGFIGDNYAMAAETGADCVRFGRTAHRIGSDGDLLKVLADLPPYHGALDGRGFSEHPDYYYYGSGGVWTGIYRRALLLEFGIGFDERLRHGFEDILFNDEVYRHARTVAFNEGCYYIWKRRESRSASASGLTDDRLLGLSLVLAAEDALFEGAGLYETNPDFCARRLATLPKDLLTMGHYGAPTSFAAEREAYRRIRNVIEPYAGRMAGRRVGPEAAAIRDCLLGGRYRILYALVSVGVKSKLLLRAKGGRCGVGGRHGGPQGEGLRNSRADGGAPIDILMATYNGERFVGEQIASLQLQTHGRWRLLVSDDCSGDGTLDAVRACATRDSRIEVVSGGARMGGAKENFMSLLACSDAPYVMFCDQDDVWLADKVERTHARMRELEEAHGLDVPLAVFSDMAVVDERLDLVHPSFMRYSNLDPTRIRLGQLLEQNVAAGCTMMLNRALADLCLQACGASARDAGEIKMHDWWAMLVASAFGAVGYVGEPLSLYRQHGANKIGAERYETFKAPDSRSEREANLRSRIAQAELFREAYGDPPREEDARSLLEYVALGRATTFRGGVARLMASSCWKRGLRRKVGQVQAARAIAAANRVAVGGA